MRKPGKSTGLPTETFSAVEGEESCRGSALALSWLPSLLESRGKVALKKRGWSVGRGSFTEF
ncbi:MAG: hypothetical protein PHP75_02875 [Methylacidiphilaceae bacterium]|nr:hypothetical protein [Candidatus Methylacidiphilaceae bacterium]